MKNAEQLLSSVTDLLMYLLAKKKKKQKKKKKKCYSEVCLKK